ncbi:hypothetical protein ABW21_db0207937 [Orbilia brochopaga]|nr:hypothetical protein ABW21_db0207937 [Drechslerella brochopaga]
MEFIATAPGLQNRVPKLDLAPDLIIVRDEVSTAGRFMQHVGQVIGKAWSASRVEDVSLLRFHDAHVNTNSTWRPQGREPSIPDIVISKFEDNRIQPQIVGELKTAWTVDLHPVQIPDRGSYVVLEPHLGQLVRYMRVARLTYGFLSTYDYTIFIRRTGPYRFEMTAPMHHTRQYPSVREAFFYIGNLVTTTGPTFVEDESFDTTLLSVQGGTTTNSPRKSPYRTFQQSGGGSSGDNMTAGPSSRRNRTAMEIAESTSINLSSINEDSIFYGDGSVVTGVVQPMHTIKTSPDGRCVYEALWMEETVIAKYWPEPWSDKNILRRFRYHNEVGVYQLLPKSRFIPEMLAHGKVMLSNKHRKGHLVVLRKVEGEVFSKAMWQNFSADEKIAFRQELLDAHKFLRDYDLMQGDIRRENVFVYPETNKVVLLDMEQMRLASDDGGPDDLEVDYLLNMNFA